MEPQIQYCTTDDGVRIAYSVQGEGPEVLVLQSTVESLSLFHLVPEWQDFLRKLGQGRRLIRYDMRGTGMSQRDVADLSHEALIRDLEAVADTATKPPFTLYASTLSGPRAIEFAARHPHFVSRLILFNTFARVLDAFSKQVLEGLVYIARADWALATRTIADLGARQRQPDLGLQVSECIRQSASGELLASLIESNSQLDITSVLGDVTCPTLVLQGIGDPTSTPEAGQVIASGITNARLVTIRMTESPPLMSVLDAVNAFLDEDAATRRHSTADESSKPLVVANLRADLPSGTAIILFADIVDSTALTERLGDTAFRDKARGLDEAMRGAIRDNGGTPVEGKTLGDGVLAMFTSAKQAIACAQACHDAAGTAGLSLHVGIHAGDVIREADNVYGGAVNIAARVAAASAAGETLVSATVRELARTSAGVAFEDRGEQALKGIDEPVRVWAVVEGA